MKTILIYLGLVILSSSIVYSQGCIAVRGGGMCGGGAGSNINLSARSYSLQVGYRYFQSFRHYRGDHEEKNRMQEGSEVINTSHFTDILFNYGITDRWYVSALVPFVAHNRTSMYEHGGNPPAGLARRHATEAGVLADVRFGLGYWLFDPKVKKFNYALGIGIKLPTGRFNAEDSFYNQGTNRNQTRIGVVDQSIQPGDGGTGLSLELQGVHPIGHHITVSTNLFYLFNFQETNGVKTRTGTGEFSCPDQLAARVSGNYNHASGFSFSMGGRMEGIPSSDIFGGDAGFRRPGYIISAEPGIGYSKGNFSAFASLPISLYRNRVQNYEDKESTASTGIFRQGDAAFADYMVNISIGYRFGK